MHTVPSSQHAVRTSSNNTNPFFNLSLIRSCTIQECPLDQTFPLFVMRIMELYYTLHIYIYIYIYICIYMYIYMCVYVYIRMYVCMYACMYVCMYANICLCMYVHDRIQLMIVVSHSW